MRTPNSPIADHRIKFFQKKKKVVTAALLITESPTLLIAPEILLVSVSDCVYERFIKPSLVVIVGLVLNGDPFERSTEESGI